jgi:hypothetical protein
MDILTKRRAAVTRAAQALLLLTLPFIAGVLVLSSPAGCSGWSSC